MAGVHVGLLVTNKPAYRFLSTENPAACFLSGFKAFTHQRESIKSFLTLDSSSPSSCINRIVGQAHM